MAQERASREERYRFFAHTVESSREMISITDVEDRFTFVNGAFLEAYGYTEDEVLGQHVSLVDSPRNPPGIRLAIVEETLRGGFRGELLNRRKDGSEFPIFLSTSQVRDPEGNVIALSGIARDITDKRAAEALRSALYRIAEQASAATDIRGFYAFVHGVVGELMVARNFYIALHDPALSRLRVAYYADEIDPFQESYRLEEGLTGYVFRTGEPLLCSERPRDGEPAEAFAALAAAGKVARVGKPSVDWLGVPLTSGGSTIGVLVVQSYVESERYGAREKDVLTFVARNITAALERLRAGDALRESEERFRTLSNATFEGIVIHDRGVIQEVNRAFSDLMGRGVPDLLGMSVVDLVAPESLDAIATRLKSPSDDPFELAVLRGDGTRVRVQVQGKDIRYQGRLVRVSAVRDVTLRMQLEEQLRQSQKMEAVGRLAGGVAHDFNNLLTTILGFAEQLSAQLGEDPRRGEVDEILRAGERAAALTQQLLAFSRKQILAPQPVDLNGVVTSMEKMLRRVIGEDVDLVTSLGPDLGHVMADAGQIGQVVVNLAVNARDAMPDGGTLTLETGRVKGHVHLTVRDTGHGMDARTQSHLFEPFFTTKEVGKGTGLGLATVYGVISQAGGTIECESAPGAGTSFRITFPRVEGEESGVVATSAGPEPPAASSPGARETILLVEDEETVRRLGRRILEGKGYLVLEAKDGADALLVAAAHPGPIDLLVADLVMPGMSGREVAQKLTADRPGLKVLFVSGYTEDTAIRRRVSESDVSFLQKPFTVDALSRKVREVLDAPR